MLTENTKVVITKGCPTLNLVKGISLQVKGIYTLDSREGVRITFTVANGSRSGQPVTLYAHYSKHLERQVIRLTNGNTSNFIEIRVPGSMPVTSATKPVTDPKVVSRHRTLDGIILCIWDDGEITQVMGTFISDVIYPRAADKKAVRKEATSLIADTLCDYTYTEIPNLIRAAEVTVSNPFHPRRVDRLLAVKSLMGKLPKFGE